MTTTEQSTIENPYLDYLDREVGFDPLTVGDSWSRPQYDWTVRSEHLRDVAQAISEGKQPDFESVVSPTHRHDWLCVRYSWGIPNEEAIRLVATHSPIVEIGAGTGYWAWLLSQAGADVVAYDWRPPTGSNPWVTPGNGEEWDGEWLEAQEPFFDVRAGEPPMLRKHSDRALLLCWPPKDDPFAADCLRYYRGNKVIYVGEIHGYSGTPEFFSSLAVHFQMVAEFDVPQWWGNHDFGSVWERKFAPGQRRNLP